MSTDASQAMFRQGAQRHRSGDLVGAGALYQQALQADAGNADAAHGLGLIHHAQGDHQRAIELIERALKIRGDDAAMLNNLAEVFRVANRLEDALKTLDRALAVRPQLAEAHYNRALVLQLLGRSDEAMIGYERALRENPQHTAAMVNLGNMLQQRGDLEGSEVLYSRAVEVDPMHAEALRNLGLLKQNTRRVPEALVLLQRAVAIRPDFVEALDNLGSALQALGRPEQAIVYHQRAAEINPAFAVALNNLGNALLRLGRGEEAVAAYRKAVVANPDFSDAHYNIGSVAQTLGWLDEAVEGYRRRVALKPDDMAAINNLANILKDQAKLDEALDLFRRAAAALNESGGSHDNALYTSLYSDSVTAEDSFAEHLRWGQRFADPLTLAAPALENDRDPQRRIRIGYVSPYFRAHALGILLEPLVARHDKERFEVFFYSDTSVHDEANTRYRTYADAWRETTGVPDPALAEMIRHDRIDVLIDLNLHMAGSRLMAFARKPAPVQISYLAYPATSGMAAMDYLITDPYLDPPDRASKLHRERLLRLPQAYWCYLPMDPTPEVGPLPADEVGYITFGSYNNFCKLNPRVARTWGQILGRVPQARLRVLIVGKKDHNLGAGKLLTDAGIDAHRLELVEYQPRLKYLEEFNRTDIVLDPFPCNGHTSSLDALWMGVPVVTLEGQGAFGRAGVCLNRNLGLDDLIASNESEYIEKAVKLQEDRPRLRWLRSGLRQRFKQSPLYDAQRTTRALESLYRQAWSDWCAHAPPVRAPSKPALSVCVALKDRSRRTGPDGRVMEPFPQCVKSLAKALPLGEKVELVVADFSSRDWPLEQWLDSQAAGMSVKILPIEGEFLRGRARNEAAKAASADTLFFCDADMLVPPGLLSTGLDMARRGMAFFPVCQLTTPDGALGAICATGYGNTFISRARFEKAGGWPEFKSWGGEDNLFWDRCYHDGEVSRIVVPGFLHQWHPLEFRDEFASRPRLTDYHDEVRGRSKARAGAGAGALVAVSATADLARLARQTPGGMQQWDGVEFVFEPVESCDLLVGINRVPEAAMNIRAVRGWWTLVQEPPVGASLAWHEAQKGVSRVFTQDPTRTGAPYVQSQGALPWQVAKCYDELIDLPPLPKTRELSCVCGYLDGAEGQRQRREFVHKLSAIFPFDRFGRGGKFMADKWDALADWKYSIAIESFSGPHYWTEKLVDCFLAWTLPFYCGCTNLESYFPAESFIRIDMGDPEAAAQIMQQAIREDWWSKRLTALGEARRLALTKYQFFPFIVAQMRES